VLHIIADWLVDVMWRPEIGGFRSKQSERVFKTGMKNYRCVIGLPYAYLLKPREKYLEVFNECMPNLRERLGPQCAKGQVQKAFSWSTRFAPMFWRHYAQIGLPVANAGDDRLIPVDLKLQVDGSASRAMGGHQIVKYEWSFGDGATAQGVRAEHTYAKPGAYKVTLRVAAANGKTDTDSFLALETPAGEHVSNGGFEADSDHDGVPDGWTIRRIGKPRTVWDDQVAHSGRRSVRMECDDVGVETHILQLHRPVLPDREYVFSCWVKTENVVIQKRHNKTGPYAIVYPKPQENYRCTGLSAPAGTDDWKRFDARLKTLSTDRTIDIYCKFRYSSGTVWFDDVSLKLAD